MKKRIIVLVLCMILMLTAACSRSSEPSPSQPKGDTSSTATETSGGSDDPIVITIFGVPTTIPETDPVIPELESRLSVIFFSVSA